MDGIAADEPVGSSSASSKGPGSTKGLTQRGALENPQGSRESYTHHLFPLREWWYLGTSCRLIAEWFGNVHYLERASSSHLGSILISNGDLGMANPMYSDWCAACVSIRQVRGAFKTSNPFSWHNSTGKHDVAAPLSTVAHTTFKAALEFSPWLRKFSSESELVSSYLNRFRRSSLLSSLPSSLRPRSSFIWTSRVPSSRVPSSGDGDLDLSRSRSSRLSRISRGIKLIGIDLGHISHLECCDSFHNFTFLWPHNLSISHGQWDWWSQSRWWQSRWWNFLAFLGLSKSFGLCGLVSFLLLSLFLKLLPLLPPSNQDAVRVATLRLDVGP